ncbi:MAG: hypothetical protein OEM22_07405 [Acidimicrobiia bacterium]|nr:hypothetical protein [Acidimicrobiia bacterium]MDH3471008.1 hypothetical protein [Acidimicrobiia bacterium]
MASLTGSGMSLNLPAGWEAEIKSASPSARNGTDDRVLGETHHSLTHAANFPLPPDRGDFGSGAVEVMRSVDVLMVLFEYHPSNASKVLFEASGLPAALKASDFDPNSMQRPLRGQSGTQKFFNEAGRAFCLYVVLGSHANRSDLLKQVNAALTGWTIT